MLDTLPPPKCSTTSPMRIRGVNSLAIITVSTPLSLAAGIITQSMEGHWSIFLPIIVIYFPKLSFISCLLPPLKNNGRNEAGECNQLSLVSDQYHVL